MSALWLSVVLAATPRVGTTLHPYDAWVRNIVDGTPVEVVAVLPAEIDAGNYQPTPEDVARLRGLDALVVNGLGHDAFIEEMVKASGNSKLVLIRANDGVPLLKVWKGEAPNSHTFLSLSRAGQQVQVIARTLGRLFPAWAKQFQTNAAVYVQKLRALKAETLAAVKTARHHQVITVHDGYAYLLEELGLTLVGVVEPAHGLLPSAKELGAIVELIKTSHVEVVLSEETFPAAMVEVLKQNGARVAVISHIATGDYSKDAFLDAMRANLKTLVAALNQ